MFDFFFGSPNKIPENLKPGEISWSELKIGEPIKKGGQATTYLATYKNQTVVVKKFNLEKEGLGEYEILKDCEHENVIKTFGYTTKNKEFYLILEKADTDLSELISKNSLSMEDKLNYLRQTAEGLKYLHGEPLSHLKKENGEIYIVHRDLNPNNILVFLLC
jgi:serine/threonine protein kinase